MKGSLDDNYSIPRFPSIDENLNVSRKRSIARRPFNKAFLFLFLHFPRPPPPMATFSLPSQGENQSDAMPDTRDPGRRSPLGRSPIEGQSKGGERVLLEKALWKQLLLLHLLFLLCKEDAKGERKGVR